MNDTRMIDGSGNIGNPGTGRSIIPHVAWVRPLPRTAAFGASLPFDHHRPKVDYGRA
jgi:hypothetical protein